MWATSTVSHGTRRSGDLLPDTLVPFAERLRDAHEAVEHAQWLASFDELDGGLWDRLREDAFFAAPVRD